MKPRDNERKPNWPPTWTWISGEVNKYPRGEVGVLKEAHLDQPRNRILLFMEYRKSLYMGCLSVTDPEFGQSLGAFLESHLGQPLQEIGNQILSLFL